MAQTSLLKWAQFCLEYCMTCNATCRHCCVESSPHRREKMGIERAKRYIDQAAGFQCFRELGIGGGEALIFYDEILEIMRYAHTRHRFSITISTNGYWARTPEVAAQKIAEMKEAGLRSFLVSVDDFHQEFVKLEPIRNLLKAASDLDVSVYLQSIVSKSSRIDEIRRALSPYDPRFQWGEFPCIPAGFAKTQVPKDDYILVDEIPREGCTISRLVRVKVDGKVKPCCGAGVPERLVIGDLEREPLGVILDRINRDPIINAIAIWRGPRYLAQVLAEEGYPEALTGPYAGACHACGHILNDPKLLAVLQRRLGESEGELRDNRRIVERDHYFPTSYHLAPP